ncbi:hypothetical protein ACU6TU_04410 [Halomonas sp. LS-001]
MAFSALCVLTGNNQVPLTVPERIALAMCQGFLLPRAMLLEGHALHLVDFTNINALAFIFTKKKLKNIVSF